MTKSDNIIIAEFLEFQETNIGWFDYNEVLSLPNTTDNTFDELSFDKSYDWLMPVIQKLFNTDFKEYSNLEELMEEYFNSDVNMVGFDFNILFNKTAELIKKLKK